MLSSFTYSPGITGSSMHSAVTGALKTQDPNLKSLGLMYWQTVLGLLYGDFTQTLNQNLLTYINQTEVKYLPGVQSSVVFVDAPVLSQFVSKITSSASIIDTNIKAACSSQKASLSLGINHWEEVFKQIFTDICDVISQAITTSYSKATNTCPVGAIAAGTAGLTAPVPAKITVPFVSADLKSQLQKDFSALNAKTLASSLTSQIQSTFQSYNSTQQFQTIGDLYWTFFLQKLSDKMSTYLKNDIKQWIVSKPQHFAIPQGSPGINPAGIPPTIPSTADTLGFMM